MKHPDWAAAYILVDWNKRGRKVVKDITAAYEAYERKEGTLDEDRAEEYVKEHIDEAIKRFEVYLAALKDARDGTA